MRKKVIVSLLVAGLLLGIAACSGGGAGSDPDDSSTDPGKELKIKIVGCGQVLREPNQKRYEKGKKVSITAKPEADFKKWTGGVESEAAQESIIMDSDYQLVANFYSKFILKTENKLYTINDNGSNLTEVLELAPQLQIKELYYLAKDSKLVFIGEETKIEQKSGTKVADQEIYTLDIYNQVKKQITNTKPNFQLVGGDWNLNRRQALVIEEKADDSAAEIYRLGIVNNNRVKLTDNNRLEAEAVWGPDGEQIAFTAVPSDEEYASNPVQGGDLDLYLMTAQGKEEKRIVDIEDAHIKNIAWLRGGRILFTAKNSEVNQRYLVDAEGNKKVKLEEYLDLSRPIQKVNAFPQRDKLILSTKTQQEEKTTYYLADIPGGRTVEVKTNFASQPTFRWGANEEYLLAEVKQEQEEKQIYLLEASSGEVKQVVTGHHAVWVENGEEFIFCTIDQEQAQEELHKYNLKTKQISEINKKFKSIANLELIK